MGLIRNVMTIAAISLSQDAAQAVAPHFPAVQGKNLNGRSFSLPADFGGELNVVLIAFKREQQADVDTWTPMLRRLADTHQRVRVYELPTLPRTLKLIRGFIDGGMRGGIPDTAVRAATITLYIDKTPFKQAINIFTEDQIQVVLADRTGRIHWRWIGRFGDAAGAALEQAVAAASESGVLPKP
jgi:hypothetical protein